MPSGPSRRRASPSSSSRPPLSRTRTALPAIPSAGAPCRCAIGPESSSTASGAISGTSRAPTISRTRCSPAGPSPRRSRMTAFRTYRIPSRRAIWTTPRGSRRQKRSAGRFCRCRFPSRSRRRRSRPSTGLTTPPCPTTPSPATCSPTRSNPWRTPIAAPRWTPCCATGTEWMSRSRPSSPPRRGGCSPAASCSI